MKERLKIKNVFDGTGVVLEKEPPVADTYETLYRTLNEEQAEVFNKIINGENVFITGNAGTGKSYIVKVLDKFCEEYDVCLVKTAPTGISANEIGGATLHHQFGLNIGLDFSKPMKYPKEMDGIDILLIDEISMVRIDVFDRIMQLLTMANMARSKKNKQEIQLVLVGDFYQLPPVITKDEKPFLDEHYGKDIKGGYCFQSKFWNLFGIQLCNLKTVMRQEDVEFCKALDKCKRGDKSFVPYIRSKRAQEEVEQGIWVCGKNATVAEKNAEELEKLEGNLFVSYAEYEGEVTPSDKLCDDVFAYKIGAKVVMLANDISENKYNNGTLGTIIKATHDTITVKMENGNVCVVRKQKVSKYEYRYKEKANSNTASNEQELTQEEIGYAEQFPMRLGYAVTIHKSQGQTYNYMNLSLEIFSNGQLYVALSRCKKIENLYIKGMITDRMIMTSEDVKAFYDNPLGYSYFDEHKAEPMCNILVPKKYEEKVKAYIKQLKAEE